MRFIDVPGNKKIKNKLIDSKESGRIPHAQLFVGENGSSALSLAWAYANYLLCKNSNKDACLKCSSCLQVQKMTHPDLRWVFPLTSNRQTQPTSDFFIKEFKEAITKNPYITEGEWYAMLESENKQGIIGVKEATEITKKIHLKSSYNGYKIVLIWLVEKMNTTTSNKMLKLLEEPPEKTIFLLITNQKEQLLPTIKSRVQSINIDRLTNNEMTDFLTKIKPSSELIDEIVQTTQGNINKAIKLLQGEDEFSKNTQNFQEWIRLCYQANIIGITDWVEKTSKQGREKQKIFLTQSLNIIRQSILYPLTGQDIIKTQSEEMIFLERFSPFIHKKNMLEIVKSFETAFKDLGRNINTKILFTDLSLELAQLLRVKNKKTQ